ncbi:DUF4062 domain-containing protein [Rhizobium leguminosarum]
MEKRYQVFVSSTFKDLEQERQEVMHALLELDCLPAGMELFPAANEEQWSLIKKVIDDSDYYVLIVGGRYGSIGPEGHSYTEMEYRHALSIGKPIIAFLHRDPGTIVAAKTENKEEGQKKLAAFRELVERKLCKYWTTPQDLGSVVSRSLIQLIKSHPAIGWVRANELPNREATAELLRLRRQVDDLEKELKSVRTSAPKGSEMLSQGAESHNVNFIYALGPNYDLKYFKHDVKISWDEIFAACAPTMIHEANEDAFKSSLNDLMLAKGGLELRKIKRLEKERLSHFEIADDDFQTIKIQLRALGLIIKSDKPRSVKDTGTYWTLTPYGDEVMTRLRAIPAKVSGADLFSGTSLTPAEEEEA